MANKVLNKGRTQNHVLSFLDTQEVYLTLVQANATHYSDWKYYPPTKGIALPISLTPSESQRSALQELNDEIAYALAIVRTTRSSQDKKRTGAVVDLDRALLLIGTWVPLLLARWHKFELDILQPVLARGVAAVHNDKSLTFESKVRNTQSNPLRQLIFLLCFWANCRRGNNADLATIMTWLVASCPKDHDTPADLKCSKEIRRNVLEWANDYGIKLVGATCESKEKRDWKIVYQLEKPSNRKGRTLPQVKEKVVTGTMLDKYICEWKRLPGSA